MAPSFLASVGTQIASTGGTTLSVTPGADVPVGTTMLIECATNGATGDAASMADNSTEGGEPNNYAPVLVRQGNAGGQVSNYVFLCRVTRRILTSNSITLTTPTTSRRAMTVQSYTGFINPVVRKIGASLLTTGSPVAPNAAAPWQDPTQAVHVMVAANNTTSIAGFGAPTNGFTLRATAMTAGGSVDKCAMILDLCPGVVGTTVTQIADTNTVGYSTVMMAIEEGLAMFNPINANRRVFQGA